jgi:hypothetical protein
MEWSGAEHTGGKGQWMFTDLTAQGWAILIVLVGMLVVGVISWTVAWSHLRHEEKEARNIADAIPAEPTPELLATVRKRLTANHDLHFAQFLESVLDADECDRSQLDLSGYLHWPRFLSGIFVFVGLLGTVWGITVAISSLGIAMPSTGSTAGALDTSAKAFDYIATQQQRMGASIGSLLSGIKSASVCTLFGIFFTLILAGLNSYYLRVCEHIESNIALLGVKLINARRYHATQTQQRLHGVTDVLEHAARVLNGAVPSLAGAADKLSDTVTGIQKCIDDIGAQSTEQGERLEETLESVESVSHALQHLSETIVAERSGLADISGRVGSAAERMTTEVRNLSEKLLEDRKQEELRLEAALDRQEALHSSLEALLRRFDSVLLDVASITENSPLRKELLTLKADLFKKLNELANENRTTSRTSFREEYLMPSPSIDSTPRTADTAPDLPATTPVTAAPTRRFDGFPTANMGQLDGLRPQSRDGQRRSASPAQPQKPPSGVYSRTVNWIKGVFKRDR